MEKVVEKFHALQLFTDTFIAETVHLSNKQVGIYIRLLCFAWTKNAKAFNTTDAYTICQCRDESCEREVFDILEEFFILKDKDKQLWEHKRLIQEHKYLSDKYKARSEAGRKGGLAKSENASNKTIAPIPIPRPIPNKQLLVAFDSFWEALLFKKGSKKLACQRYLKECGDMKPEDVAASYNKYSAGIQDKQYCAQVSTWLNQRRFEDEINNNPTDIKIPPETYIGIILKRNGEFGNMLEFIDDNGNKYQKHKFKAGAKVEKVI